MHDCAIKEWPRWGKILSLLGPLLGVIVGVLSQHLSTRSTQNRGRLLEARVKAYADYVSAMARKGRITKNEQNDTAAIFSQIDDAKYRICIYGSEEVITALAEFEKSKLETKELKNKFLRLCQAMRKDSGSGEFTNLETIDAAIYGTTSS